MAENKNSNKDSEANLNHDSNKNSTINEDISIADLSRGTKKKSQEAIIYTLIGIIVIGLSLALLCLKINPPWIQFSSELEHQKMMINVTFVLWIGLFLLGLFLISRIFMNRTQFKENKPKLIGTAKSREKLIESSKKLGIFSFSWSRFISVILLLISVYIQYSKWGIAFTSETYNGNWFALGGPSLFYPTAVIPLIIAVGLIVYVILSPVKLTFSESYHFFNISEKRYAVDFITEIPKEKIRGFYLTNAKSGPKFLWVILFGIQIWLLGVSTVAYLTNPFTFGLSITTGLFYLFQIIVDLIVLGILVFKHQLHLEIHTDKKRYELEFSSFGRTKKLSNRILSFFKILPEDRTQEIDKTSTGKRKYSRLLTGIFFVALAIITRIFMIYSDQPLRMALFIGGIILIIKGIKNDLQKNGFDLTQDKISENSRNLDLTNKSSGIQFKRIIMNRFWKYRAVYAFSDSPDISIDTIAKTQVMDIFDYLIMLGIPFIMGMGLVSTIVLTPIGTTIYFGFVATQFLFIVLFAIIFRECYLKKENYLRIKTENQVYFIKDPKDERKLKFVGTDKNMMILKAIGLIFAYFLGAGAFYFVVF